MIILLIALLVAADQISKYLVAANLAGRNIEIIHNFFYITYAENTGMAWSLLSGQQALFCLAAAAAIGVMIWYMIYKDPGKWTRVALAFMIAGAAGNLIDRLLLGHVRDFLHFYIFSYDFPIFNVADSALTIGVILLIIGSFLEEKAHE
jgi:lipoprotein signal peptidase